MSVRYFLSALTVLLIAGCAPVVPPTPKATPFMLADTKWTLTSMVQNGATRTPPAGTEITLDFTSDGKVGGNSGCNSYGGTYEAQGEILKISALVSTLMACAESEKMDFEAAYVAGLQAAQMFERTADQLSVTFGNGTGKLVFRARS